MRKKIDRSLWIGSLISLLPIAFGLIYYNKLPGSMVIHLDSGGNPNGYAPREFVIFIFPVLMLLLNGIVNISVTRASLRSKAAKPLIMIGEWVIPIVVVIIQPLMILKSVGNNAPVNNVITIIVGLIFILSGNYFPKNRINPNVGVKFPWLLHDEEGWRKTHKLSGYLWIIAGFILILSPFVKVPFTYIFVAFISLIAFIPIVYSLYLYIRPKSNDANS